MHFLISLAIDAGFDTIPNHLPISIFSISLLIFYSYIILIIEEVGNLLPYSHQFQQI
jgi:hypothetical protein